MIAGRDLIIVSDNWDGLRHGVPTSAIHLFSRLSRSHRVFWFNTISRMPKPTRADLARVARTVREWASGPREAARRNEPVDPRTAGVRVAAPFMVPWFKPAGRRLNRLSMRRAYGCLRERHGIANPIVLTTAPYGVDFLAAIDEGLKVYYCVDEFLDYPNVNRTDWAAMEAELLGSIDGLVVTSRDLGRKKRPGGCPVLYLPHGVDYDHFHVAAIRRRVVPHLEALPRPIVGFFGLISEWVDLGLMAHLSETFPTASFVLYGRADVELGPLDGRPNVHYFGPVPYDELPDHARYFDIGLIPFVLNDLTRAVNPLKLLEYFALGMPVLATRLPELEGVEGPLRLAVGRDEFRAGLAELVAGGPGLGAKDAWDAAREHTWDRRAEDLGTFLEDLAAGRGAAMAGEGRPC